jgi:hypothetical protein
MMPRGVAGDPTGRLRSLALRSLGLAAVLALGL